MKPHLSALPLLSLLLCPACAVEDDDLELRTTLSITSGGGGGGPVFNTHAVDDHFYAEFREEPDEHSLAILGVRLPPGLNEQELPLAAITIDGGEIVVPDGYGGVYDGDALVGTRWSLGNPLWSAEHATWITGRTLIEGVPHYSFAHFVPVGDQSAKDVVDNCGGTPEQPRYARMLPGFTLDEKFGDITSAPGTIYVACEDAAVAKAASWGYYDLALALADLEVFETAIRVVRADYCYDGHAHTVAGVELLVEDRWGVRPADGRSKEIEAVWGAGGLICFGQPRIPLEGELTCDGLEIPSCEEGVDHFADPRAQFVTRRHGPGWPGTIPAE